MSDAVEPVDEGRDPDLGAGDAPKRKRASKPKTTKPDKKDKPTKATKPPKSTTSPKSPESTTPPESNESSPDLILRTGSTEDFSHCPLCNIDTTKHCATGSCLWQKCARCRVKIRKSDGHWFVDE